MSKILTLVNTHGLRPGLEAAVREHLQAGGAVPGGIRRFPVALEIAFSGDEPALDGFAGEWQVDFAVQDAAAMPKRLLVSDMESTLVGNEFLDDLAELAGVGERVKAITARAMNGEIDFADALRERLALLEGQPVALLERAWTGLRWMPGAPALVAILRDHGVPVIIVSGGFKFFTSRVRTLLGAARDEANDLEIRDGRLTGRPLEPILGRENKERILRAAAQEMGLSLAQTAAVGDGANDLPMLQAAGLGLAYHAKPSVNALAPCRIRHSDLRAVLYFMGWAPSPPE